MLGIDDRRAAVLVGMQLDRPLQDQHSCFRVVIAANGLARCARKRKSQRLVGLGVACFLVELQIARLDVNRIGRRSCRGLAVGTGSRRSHVDLYLAPGDHALRCLVVKEVAAGNHVLAIRALRPIESDDHPVQLRLVSFVQLRDVVSVNRKNGVPALRLGVGEPIRRLRNIHSELTRQVKMKSLMFEPLHPKHGGDHDSQGCECGKHDSAYRLGAGSINPDFRHASSSPAADAQ